MRSPHAARTTRKLLQHVQHRAESELMESVDEELIQHGWEEDVWFHVDNLSSAHIYLRMPEGESWEKISEPLLTDCAQLTKANSIEGEHDYGRNRTRQDKLMLMFHRQQEG